MLVISFLTHFVLQAFALLLNTIKFNSLSPFKRAQYIPYDHMATLYMYEYTFEVPRFQMMVANLFQFFCKLKIEFYS